MIVRVDPAVPDPPSLISQSNLGTVLVEEVVPEESMLLELMPR